MRSITISKTKVSLENDAIAVIVMESLLYKAYQSKSLIFVSRGYNLYDEEIGVSDSCLLGKNSTISLDVGVISVLWLSL